MQHKQTFAERTQFFYVRVLRLFPAAYVVRDSVDATAV